MMNAMESQVCAGQEVYCYFRISGIYDCVVADHLIEYNNVVTVSDQKL